ncbi:MAG: hypothetical protein WAX04_03190 [Oscillospiraceae bacterium]
MFKKLKTILFANDIEQKSLCQTLNKSQTYLSTRMMGRKPFTIEDIYTICDLVEISYAEIPVYFPKGGITQ